MSQNLVHHYINGQVVTAAPVRTVPVFNPALGKAVREVAMATPADVDTAVQAARAAQKAWGRSPALTRSRVMFRFKELLVQNTRKLAEIISAEHGKTVADAEGEVTRGMEVRLRRAAPAEGRVQRKRWHGRGQLRHPAAAGCGGRHHAVQLPGDGTHVDVPHRAHLR